MANDLWDTIDKAAAEVETWPQWKRNYRVAPDAPAQYATKPVMPVTSDLWTTIDKAAAEVEKWPKWKRDYRVAERD